MIKIDTTGYILHSIKLIFALIITAVIYSNLANAAGKFYKWVDDKGQVHYSQTEPSKKDNVTDNIVKIGGTAGTVKMKPYEKGRYLYCGKLELPNARLTDALVVKNIKLGLKEWTLIQKQAEQHYNEIKRTTKNKQELKKTKKWYEETSCRISWANERLKFLTSTAYKRSIELDKIQKEYQRLQHEKDRECPLDPVKFKKVYNIKPGQPTILVGDDAETFHQCTQRYDKKMKPLKDKLREYKRK